jgi:Acetyltransferase (GNAT) domain
MTTDGETSTLVERPMNGDDLARFAACFERNGSPRSMDALRWQYLANPTERMFVDLAMLGEDRVAAIYATLPVRVRIRGEVRLGLQSLDTMTDVDFRGKGLFVKLAKATFARSARDGAAFIYGFPNGSSAHGFFKKLAWQNLDPVPFLIRPLRLRYVSAKLGLHRYAEWVPDIPLTIARRLRIPPGLELATVDHFDDGYTRLWHKFYSGTVGVAVERDARYLNWRLVDKPGEDYTRLALVDGGDPVAFVAFCTKDKHAGKVGYLMELLYTPGRDLEARMLLRTAVDRMRLAGADVALAWCLRHSPNFAAFVRAGFFPFPSRFRPMELHVGARAFDSSLDTLIGDRRSWYFSYLDSDTV